MTMFGAVCSGRPIQLAEQVDSTKYVITIPNAANVSHITIFLLPNSTFTDVNYTALIYFQLPNSQEYKLLGGINPNKPSAIYKLNNNTKKVDTDNFDMGEDMIESNDTTVINIGISIEPTLNAEQLILQEQHKQSMVVAKAGTIPAPADTAQLANKIVGHAYNYLASFIDNSGKVPIKAFDNWWDKFKTKLANNPNFLDELQN
ncbi:uncharacterized protein J8A68_003915 [[Candida] subhashii]|uniref:Hikeshi-like domain-containing protein n=1 Tax=[Candida] subhashii TaxID=561895 RepID=A0A8J5QKJ5_9ASCO|nr:uncharacterized protein J8A68_003915 [[Candida] subhashii]KAG7662561.1 hypothetical protein J8A68_003915 [[Candida] subhashii]